MTDRELLKALFNSFKPDAPLEPIDLNRNNPDVFEDHLNRADGADQAGGKVPLKLTPATVIAPAKTKTSTPSATIPASKP
ncbi:MAG: hypothetical protein ACPGVO_08440 [Spirulinaceae cyanobacterium]